MARTASSPVSLQRLLVFIVVSLVIHGVVIGATSIPMLLAPPAEEDSDDTAEATEDSDNGAADGDASGTDTTEADSTAEASTAEDDANPFPEQEPRQDATDAYMDRWGNDGAEEAPSNDGLEFDRGRL